MPAPKDDTEQRQRKIQREQDERDAARKAKAGQGEGKGQAVQAGARGQPEDLRAQPWTSLAAKASWPWRRAMLLPGDVKNDADCHETVRRTVEAFGRLDVLVNNAAFQEHVDRRLEDLDDERLHETLDTNIGGYVRMARGAAAHEAGRFDHQHRLGGGPARQREAAGLCRQPGRHPRRRAAAGRVQSFMRRPPAPPEEVRPVSERSRRRGRGDSRCGSGWVARASSE